MTRPLRLAIAMDPARTRHVLPDALLDRLRESVEIIDPAPLREFRSEAARRLAGRAEILLTGWGCPPIGAAELAAMPDLKLCAHAAGTVKYFLADTVFEAGVVVTSAAEANAQPVAEFTLAMILLAGKRAFQFQEIYRQDRNRTTTDTMLSWPIGNLGRRVGIVGASRIGRRVLDLLRSFDFEVLLHDPFVGAAEAAQLGARAVGLDELLASSEIVSLHAPSLPETRHMIDRAALARMGDGATLINTARGALVDEAALLDEVRSGRLFAMIDVTDPEVPDRLSPFYDLPNLVLTPHVAGAIGLERTRLGEMAVAEIERFVRGEPLRHAITHDQLAVTA